MSLIEDNCGQVKSASQQKVAAVSLIEGNCGQVKSASQNKVSAVSLIGESEKGDLRVDEFEVGAAKSRYLIEDRVLPKVGII